MKKVICSVFVAISIIGYSQAHLGESFSGLKSRYPDKYFQIEYTNDGDQYTTASQPLGTFIYYFDNRSHLTYMCVQVPNDLQALNSQVEIYNNKYVVVSENSWKAYLEGGGSMEINLTYNDEYQTYLFYYTY